jgi:hypothetical protein
MLHAPGASSGTNLRCLSVHFSGNVPKKLPICPVIVNLTQPLRLELAFPGGTQGKKQKPSHSGSPSARSKGASPLRPKFLHELQNFRLHGEVSVFPAKNVCACACLIIMLAAMSESTAGVNLRMERLPIFVELTSCA